jgi:hypothetical protein
MYYRPLSSLSWVAVVGTAFRGRPPTRMLVYLQSLMFVFAVTLAFMPVCRLKESSHSASVLSVTSVVNVLSDLPAR